MHIDEAYYELSTFSGATNNGYTNARLRQHTTACLQAQQAKNPSSVEIQRYNGSLQVSAPLAGPEKMPGNARGGAWGGGGGQLLSQQQPAVAHVPFAMRLSTNPKLQARLCTDEGADDFAAAAYAWIVADQAYCRSFVAEGRSTSGCDSGRTRLAAEAKRESRLRLDAVCQRRGLGSWGASAWARDIAKAHYERMARHAAVLRESVVE
eukprot:SAG25_NODE_3903_length_933_cov_1.784173_1_plen_207_part_10